MITDNKSINSRNINHVPLSELYFKMSEFAAIGFDNLRVNEEDLLKKIRNRFSGLCGRECQTTHPELPG